jgi:hypothetical protein
LQNRRERLEELTLEAQEMRAKRELAKLRRDEEEEAERQEAEAQAREEEAAQRQAELELQRERMKHEQGQERMRLQREEEQEQQRREAEQQMALFRSRWLDKAGDAVSVSDYRWLSSIQRKEILEALEAEIEKRQPADEPRMALIMARTLEALAEPFRVRRDAQERHQLLTESALRSLPYLATEQERVRATAAIRRALPSVDSSADECEMRVAVEEAVRPIRQIIERRTLDERLIKWAIRELPWTRTEADETELHRSCSEILAELPEDVSEWEAKKELEPTVKEAGDEIKERDRERTAGPQGEASAARCC